MVSPPLRKHFLNMGIPLIPLEAGARAFVAEGRPADDVVVMIGGSAPPAARDAVFDIWVDETSCPYLKDHSVSGAPVVPVALAIEWFLRAMGGLPKDGTPVIRSLKVVRGIRLDPAMSGELLRITRREAESKWQLELRAPGNSNALCYSATADFAPAPPERTAQVEPAGPSITGEIYDGTVLFHGPAFQALRSLEALDGIGMSANVAGLSALGWSAEAWQTDPAAIDGMLQVGAKWSEKLLGGAVLPMAFESFHIFEPGAARGMLRATARTLHQRNSRVVCDVALAEPGGDLVALLSGAEFVLRPDLPVTAGA
jgi:hypothetical protein